MDLHKAIQELLAEKQRLDRVIESLEKLQGVKEIQEVPLAAPAKSRRGRKFMDVDARKQVSERMREYWAARRRLKAEGETS